MRIFRAQSGRELAASAVSNDISSSRRGDLPKASSWSKAKKSLRRHWQLYLIMLPAIIYFIVFKYIPMANVVLAFKDYNVTKGIWGSPWVGFKYFELFFSNPMFWTLIKNTLSISLTSMLIGFPIPIILALCLNEIRDGFFRRFTQLITYAPYFISTVIIVSMMILLLAPRTGVINLLLGSVGVQPINFLGIPSLFAGIFAWSGAWQGSGYTAVIFLAALSGVDPQLYDAAKVDGASRWQKIRHVDLPGIMPVIAVMLILNVGSLLSVSFEKVFLLQNPVNQAASEVISTYVYKIGLLNANYSFATAVGLFNSVVSLILLVLVNSLAKRLTDSNAGLW